MALISVEGIYKDGKVELKEPPVGITEPAEVIVTFTHSAHAIERETARQRAFARMKEGIPLGGPPYPKREELYDRTSR